MPAIIIALTTLVTIIGKRFLMKLSFVGDVAKQNLYVYFILKYNFWL